MNDSPWISVRDRLPEIGGARRKSEIVRVRYVHGGEGKARFSRGDDGVVRVVGVEWPEFVGLHRVTHWMPIPPLPEEES